MDSKGLKKIEIHHESNKPSSYKYKYVLILMIILIILFIIIIIIFICLLFLNIEKSQKREKEYDYLIVGSGLYGATFAYLAQKEGKKVLMIEKRNHIGGNLYCEKIEGIFVHKYGPHIFHTDNKKVWDFVNSFVEFTPYQYQPNIKSGYSMYSLPFNMWTYNQLWNATKPEEAQTKIENEKYTGIIHNFKEQALSLLGKNIFNHLIYEYFTKIWGNSYINLTIDLNKMIPKRFTYDNNYFNDRYQGIPEGCYNAMIEKMLEGVVVITNVDYNQNRERYQNKADKIVYTGKIDEYFDYKYGKLKYINLQWDTKILDMDNYQGNAVIKYYSQFIPYTRVIEYKHFEPFNKELQNRKKTVISYEYIQEWDEKKEAFYPVNDEENNELYKKYKKLADKEKNVIFGGALTQYKILDMTDIIENVFEYFGI